MKEMYDIKRDREKYRETDSQRNREREREKNIKDRESFARYAVLRSLTLSPPFSLYVSLSVPPSLPLSLSLSL